MIRRPPRSTPLYSSAASDVYKRQVWPLGLELPTGLWRLGLVMVLDALVGTALGLLASAVAKTEFQAVQMMPLVIIPQLLLAGLFMNRTDMPTALTYVSDVLPVSYSIDAVNSILAGDGNAIWAPVGIPVSYTHLTLPT